MASEGRSECDRAERQNVRSGFDCPLIADLGSPAAVGVSEYGSLNRLFLAAGRGLVRNVAEEDLRPMASKLGSN